MKQVALKSDGQLLADTHPPLKVRTLLQESAAADVFVMIGDGEFYVFKTKGSNPKGFHPINVFRGIGRIVNDVPVIQIRDATQPKCTLQRTDQAMSAMSDKLAHSPIAKDIDSVFQVEGFSFVGSSENVGMAFIKLTDWGQRSETAMQLIPKVNQILHGQHAFAGTIAGRG